MDRTLIANTTVLDGSGAAPFSADVLVEGQRIVAVQRGGGLPRDEARVIDGAGSTLMPGLIEPASEPDHLFGICRKSRENIRGLATRRWWRPAKRDDRDLVTHDAVEIGFEQTRQQR